jgi:hypothetical protein
LKRFAVEWARGQDHSCCELKIRLPHSGYRCDVAAYKPAYAKRIVEFVGQRLRQSHPVIGTTAVFECKQARSDLLNDSCQVLERLLKIHLPSTANGDSLFQEFQTYSLAAVNHKGYQKALRDISALQAGLLQKRKFENLVRHGCANMFYLVTVKNIISDYELPLNWGWLV